MKELTKSLREHAERFPVESEMIHRMIGFLERNNQKSFHNWHWDDGHITASLLVVNSEFTKVLLMFHKKHQRWLQFGGHSDDSPDVLATAIREFHEESGIEQEPEIYQYSDSQYFPIFDIDIHDIPADAKGRPQHKHYDIRFLGIVPDSVAMNRQLDETEDMQWFSIDGVEKYLEEGGLLRMMEKVKDINSRK